MATPSEKPDYVLFLTPNCKFCNNFINKLKAKPDLAKKFYIVDIDRLPAIPDEVDEVPCVYDGKGVFKGGDLKTVGEVRERIIDFIKLNATPAPVEEGTVSAAGVDTSSAPVTAA